MRQCQDCSYKGKRFPQGVCPACGSLRVRKIDDTLKPTTARKPYRLLFCVALWIFLINEILKYLSG